MPYTDEEKAALEQLFFKTKSLDRAVRSFLRNGSVDLEKFQAYLCETLRGQVSRTDWRDLLTRERVRDDPEYIQYVLDRLTGHAVPAAAAQPARPAVSAVQLPDALERWPGFPLEPRYAAQAADALRLESEDVKKALRPTEFRGSRIYALGYPYPLYHQTCKSGAGNGVANSKGKDVVTFFYAWYEGAAYLVAWGHHVNERGREVAYRVDGAVEGARILRGVLLTFESPAAEPSARSASARSGRGPKGREKEEQFPEVTRRPPKRFQTDPDDDGEEDPAPKRPGLPPKPPKKRK